MSEPTPEQIKAGIDYENLVGDFYEAHGWKVQRRGGINDGGVDLVCDWLGCRHLVQCKCYCEERPVTATIVAKMRRDSNALLAGRSSAFPLPPKRHWRTPEAVTVIVFTSNRLTDIACEAARETNIHVIEFMSFERLRELIEEQQPRPIFIPKAITPQNVPALPEQKPVPTGGAGCLNMVFLLLFVIAFAGYFLG